MRLASAGYQRVRAMLVGVCAAAVIAAGALAYAPPPAHAGIDYYCNSCVIYSGTSITSTVWIYITKSWVNYLGAGDRYLAASGVGYGWVYGWNTAQHVWSSAPLSRAQAADFDAHDVTVNAHGDY